MSGQPRHPAEIPGRDRWVAKNHSAISTDLGAKSATTCASIQVQRNETCNICLSIDIAVSAACPFRLRLFIQ